MSSPGPTTCLVVGGGPAGMVLGLLLARAGVRVTVLEKHADFLRDFRGDTVHPSTLRLLDEVGLFERFDAIPQTRVEQVVFPAGDGRPLVLADFRWLRLAHPYIAMVPQWDLLTLLAEAAGQEPTFTLRMSTEVTGLLREADRVVGVRCHGPEGLAEVRADLTVGCDGRWSVVRRESGLATREMPMNIDVWWFRVPTTGPVASTLLPRTAPGRAVVAIPRRGYLQVAYLIPKGADRRLRARGLDALRDDLAALLPEVADGVAAVTSWDQVRLLDVRLDRLQRWHVPGLLCIGDAAHAMSPMGGVGINLAVQDAVAAARLLAAPLLAGRVSEADLRRVRRRRLFPTVVTQGVQRVLHRLLIGRVVLRGRSLVPSRGLVGLIARFPWLTAVPAHFVGVGVRPEKAPAFARRAPVVAGQMAHPTVRHTDPSRAATAHADTGREPWRRAVRLVRRWRRPDSLGSR